MMPTVETYDLVKDLYAARYDGSPATRRVDFIRRISERDEATILPYLMSSFGSQRSRRHIGAGVEYPRIASQRAGLRPSAPTD